MVPEICGKARKKNCETTSQIDIPPTRALQFVWIDLDWTTI